MKILIVGLGVIGGGYAMALKEAGYEEVYGVDINTDTLKRAKEMGFTKVFALTYRQDFFESCGFKKTEIDSLPKKIWTDCLKCPKYPDCDETAVIIEI